MALKGAGIATNKGEELDAHMPCRVRSPARKVAICHFSLCSHVGPRAGGPSLVPVCLPAWFPSFPMDVGWHGTGLANEESHGEPRLIPAAVRYQKAKQLGGSRAARLVIGNTRTVAVAAVGSSL
jgi:hypothetical protein